jgi:hypothetical protein
MVAKQKLKDLLFAEVEKIYNWLDSQILKYPALAGQCKVCGACCDFGRFEHHLFVTTPELMYLAAKLGDKNTGPAEGRPMNRCPYNKAGKCTVYEYRFSACRIFCCNADKNFQSSLSESVIKKFKSLCIEFQIPYQYLSIGRGILPRGSRRLMYLTPPNNVPYSL